MCTFHSGENSVSFSNEQRNDDTLKEILSKWQKCGFSKTKNGKWQFHLQDVILF